jgi:putative ABC transport system permease protein
MRFHNLRYALRALARSPGFTLTAGLTMALGIGGACTIFTVADAVLLRPLPYADPGRLALISADQGQDRFQPFSYPRFVSMQENSRSFSGMAAFTNEVFNLTGRGEPEQIEAARVSWRFFDVLGVRPILGRGFTAEDDRPGAKDVALIGHKLWTARFGAARDIVGQSITLDSKDYAVAGVLPAGFTFAPLSEDVEIWTAKVFELNLTTPAQVQAGAGFLNAVARLAPGAELRSARAEQDALTAQYRAANPSRPDSSPQTSIMVADLQSEIAYSLRPALIVLLAAVGTVLLIACANIANLMLTRALGRRKEIAARAALGGGRAAIVRQLLAESMTLAAAGGALGLALAHWGTRALVTLSHNNMLVAAGPHIDWRVSLFAVALSTGGGALFGLAPAWQLSGADLNAALREETRGGTGSRRSGALRAGFVVAQVGLSMALLTGAGLLLRSFINLRTADLGFDPRGVVTMRVSLPPAKYGKPEQTIAFYNETLRRMGALPGVEAAAISSALPLNASRYTPATIEGQPNVALGQRPIVNVQTISPDYAKTMRVRLLSGRVFTDRDDASAPPVAIVNQALARTYWANENPIGKRIWLGRRTTPVAVVGVFGNTKNRELAGETHPEVLLPFPQLPWASLNVSLRAASADPGTLIAAARNAILAVDGDQPVTEARTLEELVDGARAQPRFLLYLLAAFSATALAIAAVGLYGLMAYAVSQRTREMGVRMALGASRGDIVRLLTGWGLRLIAAGIALGTGASLALTHLIGSLLYGTRPTDPLAFAGGALVLAVAGLAACYVPARRAVRIDPMAALRGD